MAVVNAIVVATEAHAVDSPVAECWYALYTRGRHEKVVTASLDRKGVTTFLPLVSRIHRWSDRNKTVRLPLFPGYVFVRTSATPESCHRILQTWGVVNFAGGRRGAVPIPENQIANIQTVLSHDVPCTVFPFLRVGQRVRVRGGCLEGIEGLLTAVRGHRTLVLSVEPILRSIAISLDGHDVEILSSTREIRREP